MNRSQKRKQQRAEAKKPKKTIVQPDQIYHAEYGGMFIPFGKGKDLARLFPHSYEIDRSNCVKVHPFKVKMDSLSRGLHADIIITDEAKDYFDKSQS